jgi:hypothetical protein
VNRKDLVQVLRALLEALGAQEQEPPPPPKTPSPPTEGHQAHFRLDAHGFQVFCCSAHEEAFERQFQAIEHTRAAFNRLGSLQWRYIHERLGGQPRDFPGPR